MTTGRGPHVPASGAGARPTPPGGRQPPAAPRRVAEFANCLSPQGLDLGLFWCSESNHPVHVDSNVEILPGRTPLPPAPMSTNRFRPTWAPAPASQAHRSRLPRFPSAGPGPDHIELPIPQTLAPASGDLTVMPDAVVAVVRCACGARHESLIDVQHLSEDYVAERGLAALFETLGRGAPPLAITRWLAGHRDCAAHPRPQSLPARASMLTEAVWESAVEMVAAGQPVLNLIYVLMADGEPLVLPLDEFRKVAKQCGRTEAMAGEHAAQAAMRQLIRETGRQPVAAVAVAECWLRPGGAATGSARPEALVVWATTPNAGIIRLAEIGRMGDPQGPGVVGEAATEPLDVPCPLLDGLLAEMVCGPLRPASP